MRGARARPYLRAADAAWKIGRTHSALSVLFKARCKAPLASLPLGTVNWHVAPCADVDTAARGWDTEALVAMCAEWIEMTAEMLQADLPCPKFGMLWSCVLSEVLQRVVRFIRKSTFQLNEYETPGFQSSSELQSR